MNIPSKILVTDDDRTIRRNLVLLPAAPKATKLLRRPTATKPWP